MGASKGECCARTEELMQIRNLQFDYIDMRMRDIYSRCSPCGHEFQAETDANQTTEEALRKVRENYDAHVCKNLEALGAALCERKDL
jgi:hypothetical protein